MAKSIIWDFAAVSGGASDCGRCGGGGRGRGGLGVAGGWQRISNGHPGHLFPMADLMTCFHLHRVPGSASTSISKPVPRAGARKN